MADEILTPISREKAIEQGLKVYFTGIPCVHGHIAHRRVGSNNQCVECKRIGDLSYARKTKSKKASYDAEYRARNADVLKNKKAEWRSRNKEQIRINAGAARKNDPDRFRSYNERRSEKRKAEIKAWRSSNKDHVCEYKANYLQHEKAKRSNSWIAGMLRQRLAMAVAREFRSGSAVRDLGCSIQSFREYIETKFKEGMSWENWGRNGWHIDHIKPLASFDLSDRNQLLKACHYTNLQPLWAEENIKKGSKTEQA